MSEPGKILREAREAQGLSLSQVESQLKIKQDYLLAIEEENYEDFPSGPMLRGFIRNYAAFLGLDPAHVLNIHMQKQTGNRFLKDRQAIQFMDLTMIRRRPVFHLDGFLSVIIIASILGVLGYYFYLQYLGPDQTPISALGPPVEYAASGQTSDTEPLLLPTPTVPPTATPTSTPTPTPEYYTGVTVELNIIDRSWVQVLVDGEKEFEGFLEIDERPHWVGERQVAIRAGNGGGVEIVVNGQNMGRMGEPGQVIDQVWEKIDSDTNPATASPTPAADTNTP